MPETGRDDDKVTPLRPEEFAPPAESEEAAPPAAADDGSQPQEDFDALAGEDAQTIDTEPPGPDPLTEAMAEIGRLKDLYVRAAAEVENQRRRAARDVADAGKYAVTGFARDLLGVADNLRRALDSVDPATRAADPALEALVTGVEMTERELLAAFQRNGIIPIIAEGRRFDPHVHEAMFEVPDESVPNGIVVNVVEPGYMIHDRPLRPARVGVSKGGPKAEPSANEADESSGTGGPSMKGQAAYEKQVDALGSAGSQVDQET